MGIIVKKHIAQNGFLTLAICDENLLGKKFEEGKLQLDLTSSFYKGNVLEETEILQLMNKAYISNLVGKLCIDMAIKNQLISENDVKQINGIAYANIMQVDE